MFEKAFDFFINSNHKLSKKLALTVIVVSMLVFTDYFFRFSDTYIAEKKIEQLSKINEVLKQDSISSYSKTELLRIEKQVIKRQGFWDGLSDLISLIQTTISSPKAINKIPNETIPIKIDKKDVKNRPVMPKKERDVFWHIVTSCWFFILMMVIVPIAPFTKNNEMDNKISFILLMELILILFCGIFSYLFALIPILGNPIINYIANIALTVILIWAINKVAKK